MTRRHKTCRQCNSEFIDLDQGNRKKVCSEKCYILEMRYRRYLHLTNSHEIKEALLNRSSCDICGSVFKVKGEPVVDHCHKTNMFRGLLCRNCNTGIGLLKTPINLEKARDYVLRLESKSPTHEISRIMTLAYNRGWISSRDGNASILDGDKFYITPSGVLKYGIDPSTILVMDWTDRSSPPVSILNTKPSGEFLMHTSLYDAPDVGAVLHLHPTYTIAALHRGFNLQDFEKDFAEINRFMKVGRNVPNVPPISKELANATKSALFTENIKYDIVGQTSHGVCSTGKTLQECFEHIERLEHICQIVLASGVEP